MRQHKPTKRRVWSICNRCDLLISYQKQIKEHGKYCMEDNVNNSETSGPTTPDGTFDPSKSSEEYIDDDDTTTWYPDTSENETISEPDTSAILNALKEGFDKLTAILTNNLVNRNLGDSSSSNNSTSPKFRGDKSNSESKSQETEMSQKEIRIKVFYTV